MAGSDARQTTNGVSVMANTPLLQPLTINATVLGPGHLHVKEIINLFMSLESPDSGFAHASAFYGH